VKPKKQLKPLRQFFKENSAIFKLADAEKELRLLRSDVDELGFTHHRYERLHNGRPIYGDELILHVNDKSEVYQFNGRYHPSPAVKNDSQPAAGTSVFAATAPVITAKKAGNLALEQGLSHQMQSIDQNTLLYYPVGDSLRLAYQITLRGGMNQWDYFIDAENGRVLFEQDRRRF
jgi:bacillolysin/thermolysin